MDKGDDSAVAGVGSIPEFDQRGAPFSRVFDGDGANGPRIDIGAVELDDSLVSADFDQDKDVDGNDFLAWQIGLGTSPATKADGDADNDLDVDGDDLTVWKNQFGQMAGSAGASMPPGGSGQEGESATLPVETPDLDLIPVPISFFSTSRPVTLAESTDGGSRLGPGPDLLVHEFFVTAGADILTIGDVVFKTTDGKLYNHPIGSDTAAPDSAILQSFPGSNADSFITTPGSTAVAGGVPLVDDHLAWFDVSNDGAQVDFQFAQLTTTGGFFEGKMALRGLNGPVTVPFLFGFGDAVSADGISADPQFLAAQFVARADRANESTFQARKAFVEMLFMEGLFPDLTGDGLLDDRDIRAFVEPILEIDPTIDLERLVAEVQLPLETDTTMNASEEGLADEENSIDPSLVDTAMESEWA